MAGGPAPWKIVQTRPLIAILYEVFNHFRQIYLDGRGLPKDPDPTWLGYSVGTWEAETLAIESAGFNGKIDLPGGARLPPRRSDHRSLPPPRPANNKPDPRKSNRDIPNGARRSGSATSEPALPDAFLSFFRWLQNTPRAVAPSLKPIRGSIGGPIRKNKLFFFANYEGLLSSLGEIHIA